MARLLQKGKNTVGKREIAHYVQFLLFQQCFKRSLMQTHNNTGLFRKGLTLSETTNFSLPSSKSLQITISNFIEMVVSSPKRSKTLWHKGKLLIMNNFSFCHSVLNRFLLQIHENKALFRKELSNYITSLFTEKGLYIYQTFPKQALR